MSVLCVHNPVFHRGSKVYTRFPVNFEKFSKLPQRAFKKVEQTLPEEWASLLLLRKTGLWKLGEPYFKGEKLCLDATKYGRQQTIEFWIEVKK
ncbi:hypothetical protein phiA829_135 [Aeromonas phage phiA8-29]|uniref:Uncharacterized protein n=1 Tax=Aeromonas phage phiA8-29 TaxID=1978922 RepID=A0A1W6DYH5_9CAUD|nr:hypothetical protein HWB15_gp142 [Aeromonas phage phiA8-29]ARK07955.1 hypothetical protein phiA829_135 [Aeromonas phage phiA8-29]